ncbi:hypothetical protein K505DRAFT_344477 [Melanomma pulvis-pyrius CBS 109.77]|uniref:Uncharacterized protein n=1 Tax=Melanomma pulvis-pyrius CBS 109.77 TaxID=1314802 RepID=A0A6A6WNJ7_9PLEO|nr:hypothetical protein K505DRAFT_344477 [Melanomma pulvis-pyrius CBS 109.77]
MSAKERPRKDTISAKNSDQENIQSLEDQCRPVTPWPLGHLPRRNLACQGHLDQCQHVEPVIAEGDQLYAEDVGEADDEEIGKLKVKRMLDLIGNMKRRVVLLLDQALVDDPLVHLPLDQLVDDLLLLGHAVGDARGSLGRRRELLDVEEGPGEAVTPHVLEDLLEVGVLNRSVGGGEREREGEAEAEAGGGRGVRGLACIRTRVK